MLPMPCRDRDLKIVAPCFFLILFPPQILWHNFPPCYSHQIASFMFIFIHFYFSLPKIFSNKELCLPFIFLPKFTDKLLQNKNKVWSY